MKTMPLTAIRSFSAMVDRVDLLVLHEGRGCHNGHRIAPWCPRVGRRVM